MKYYLAYGSNMVFEQMSLRCPNAKFIKLEYLKSYELAFKKVKNGTYLDLVKIDSNSTVPVFIWSVSENDEKNLDEYEDLGDSYLKHEITTSMGTAFVYLVNPKYTKLDIPKDEYLLPILETYKQYNLDTNILLRQLKGGENGNS